MARCLDDKVEVWEPIEGFPGYEVSNQVRVRSYFAHDKGRWAILEQPRRLLRPGKAAGEHRYVVLRRGRRDHPMRVGRLVAQAFIGPAPAQSVVLHLDGDVDNNRVENLAYGALGDVRITGCHPFTASSLQESLRSMLVSLIATMGWSR
jgi:hypothetical protein